MPIAVQCPNCSAKLNAPDTAAGKRVKCPKCQTLMQIPAAAEYEEADAEPTPPPSKRKRPADEDEDERPKKSSRGRRDEDERPKKRSRRDKDEEEEEDERPRRSSRRGDDEDERPSRRRSSRRDDDEDDDKRGSRRDDRESSSAKKFNVCGLIGLILGIPSILINFFACCGGWIPGIIGGVASLSLSLVGLVLAKKSEGRMGGGLAIAGTILGGIAVLFSLLWVILFAAWFGVASTLPTRTTTFDTGSGQFGGGINNQPPFGQGGVVPQPVEPGGDAADKPVALTDPVGATLAAADFATEFKANSIVADGKYAGKIVELTGVIEQVRPQVVGESTLLLRGQGLTRPTCSFGKNWKAVDGLNFGMTVTVRGRYTGHVGGSPKLAGCVVVPRAPDGPAIKITAVDLARAYEQDKPGTDAKYDGKLMEVTGTLARIDAPGPSLPCLIEFVGQTRNVGVDMKQGQGAQFTTVPLGGLATIRGRYQQNRGALFTEGELVSTAKHPDGIDAKIELATLVLEYALDEAKPGRADKRYKGKVLEVEWGVRKVNKGGAQGGSVEFNMDNPKVVAKFAAKDAAGIANVKQVDKLKVRGKCVGVVDGVLTFEECTVVK